MWRKRQAWLCIFTQMSCASSYAHRFELTVALCILYDLANKEGNADKA